MRTFWASVPALLLSVAVVSAANGAGMLPRLPPARTADRSSGPEPLPPRGSPENAAILEIHPLDLAYPYGILYDSDTDDFWISDLAGNGGYSGDGLNHEFSADWMPTGNSIDVRNPGFSPMDGAYDPRTRMLWQMSGLSHVGCAYEMDPAVGVLTGRIICPHFQVPQSALAYDVTTDTFYSGSLDDSVIYHFDSGGTILDSADVVEHVSALVFNPATGHLFVLHRFIDEWAGPDVLIVNPAQGYSLLAAFNIERAASWSSGMRGMEMDCDGNLWIVTQPADVPFVLKVASGESAMCATR